MLLWILKCAIILCMIIYNKYAIFFFEYINNFILLQFLVLIFISACLAVPKSSDCSCDFTQALHRRMRHHSLNIFISWIQCLYVSISTRCFKKAASPTRLLCAESGCPFASVAGSQ